MPRYDQMVLLAKTEATYGVDPAPTGAANAMVMQQVEITPMAADRVAQPRVRTYDANGRTLLTGKRVMIAGTLDASASGTLGKAPAISPLLRACGLAELVVASTRVEYRPVSRGHDSATLFHHMDTTLHKGLGARGDLTFTLAAKGVPTFRTAMTGLFVVPGAAALPTVDYSAFRDADVADYEGTPTFTINGVAVPMQSLTMGMSNGVTHRELVGKREVRILGRAPRVTAVFEAPESLAQNYFALANAKAEVPLNLVHGTTAGNIVQFEAARGQMMEPSYVNDNGVQMLSIEFVLLPTAGDDEFKFIMR